MKRNFYFNQSGNLFGVVCRTKKARYWMKENFIVEPWQWFANVLWFDIRIADLVVEKIKTEFN